MSPNRGLDRVRSATVLSPRTSSNPEVLSAVKDAEAAKSSLSDNSSMEDRLSALRKHMAVSQVKEKVRGSSPGSSPLASGSSSPIPDSSSDSSPSRQGSKAPGSKLSVVRKKSGHNSAGLAPGQVAPSKPSSSGTSPNARPASIMLIPDNVSSSKLATSRDSSDDTFSEFLAEDPGLAKLTVDEAAMLAVTPFGEFVTSLFPQRPTIASLLTKIEKDRQRLQTSHEKAIQALTVQLDTRENKIRTDQKDNRGHSETLQAQETAKLEALHQERLTQLFAEQANKLKAIQRDQMARAEQSQKDSVLAEKKAVKESEREGKEEAKLIKKDKALSSSEKKQKLKIYQERRTLITQQKHRLEMFYAQQAREIDDLMERAESDIENLRVRLYFRLLQVAQIAQLGNNYLQQRQWAEMELSTQTHKLRKERRTAFFKLGTEQLQELFEFEKNSLIALLKLERGELQSHITELLTQRQKEYDARRAEKIQSKENELSKLSSELLKFAKDKKSANEQIAREQKKQRHKLQGELDTQDTLFKREQGKLRETELERAKNFSRQRCYLMQQEQKRRMAILAKQDKERGDEMAAAASHDAATLQQAQVAETHALHEKHLELRRQIEADKLQLILSLKRDQIAPLQQLMQAHAQSSNDCLEKHKMEAESSQLLQNSDYLHSLKTMHNEAIEKARTHALNSGRNLKKTQELLWVRWQPSSKSKILETSTPNSELNDETLASFLSGTQTPRGHVQDVPSSSSSSPITMPTYAGSSSQGIAFVHGRTFEQEIIDKLCFDTGLGADLVTEIIGRIGNVRETEINW